MADGGLDAAQLVLRVLPHAVNFLLDAGLHIPQGAVNLIIESIRSLGDFGLNSIQAAVGFVLQAINFLHDRGLHSLQPGLKITLDILQIAHQVQPHLLKLPLQLLLQPGGVGKGCFLKLTEHLPLPFLNASKSLVVAGGAALPQVLYALAKVLLDSIQAGVVFPGQAGNLLRHLLGKGDGGTDAVLRLRHAGGKLLLNPVQAFPSVLAGGIDGRLQILPRLIQLGLEVVLDTLMILGGDGGK